MSTPKPRPLLRIQYEKAAEAYLHSLPLEHFMQATSQATQHNITVQSLGLVHLNRPDVQTFNELLVQYPLADQSRLGQVVPDNMVVVWPEAIKAHSSYDMPFQPVGPFWVLDYLSKYTKRKNYEENFLKYERELKVPYCLIVLPDEQKLSLYQLKKGKYVSVKPNGEGRFAIAELEREIGLLDGWARYWFRGKLVPRTVELQRELDELLRQLAEVTQRAQAEEQRAEEEKARLADLKARLADEQKQRADRAQQRRLLAEQESARLRAQLKQLRTPPSS